MAPAGTLRVAINFGNPVLARRDAATGAPRGLSVYLAPEIGRRRGVPRQMIAYPAAGRVTEALRENARDPCFLAIDPGARRASPSPHPV